MLLSGSIGLLALTLRAQLSRRNGPRCWDQAVKQSSHSTPMERGCWSYPRRLYRQCAPLKTYNHLCLCARKKSLRRRLPSGLGSLFAQTPDDSPRPLPCALSVLFTPRLNPSSIILHAGAVDTSASIYLFALCSPLADVLRLFFSLSRLSSFRGGQARLPDGMQVTKCLGESRVCVQLRYREIEFEPLWASPRERSPYTFRR